MSTRQQYSVVLVFPFHHHRFVGWHLSHADSSRSGLLRGGGQELCKEIRVLLAPGAKEWVAIVLSASVYLVEGLLHGRRCSRHLCRKKIFLK
jgi:hypothetical protein